MWDVVLGPQSLSIAQAVAFVGIAEAMASARPSNWEPIGPGTGHGRLYFWDVNQEIDGRLKRLSVVLNDPAVEPKLKLETLHQMQETWEFIDRFRYDCWYVKPTAAEPTAGCRDPMATMTTPMILQELDGIIKKYDQLPMPLYSPMDWGHSSSAGTSSASAMTTDDTDAYKRKMEIIEMNRQAALRRRAEKQQSTAAEQKVFEGQQWL